MDRFCNGNCKQKKPTFFWGDKNDLELVWIVIAVNDLEFVWDRVFRSHEKSPRLLGTSDLELVWDRFLEWLVNAYTLFLFFFNMAFFLFFQNHLFFSSFFAVLLEFSAENPSPPNFP